MRARWIAAAVPDVAIAIAFAVALFAPTALPDAALQSLAEIMRIEAVLLPAVTILGFVSLLRRPTLRIGLLIFAIPAFLLPIAMLGTWVLIGAYVLLSTRIIPALFGIRDQQDRRAVGVYTACVLASFIVALVVAANAVDEPRMPFVWGILFFPLAAVAAKLAGSD